MEFHRLVGNCGGAGLDESVRLGRIGGQVEEGEQRLVGAEHLDLLELRFLHLQDQLGPFEDVFGPGHHLGANRFKVFVGDR